MNGCSCTFKHTQKSVLIGTAWTFTQTQSLFNRQQEGILQKLWPYSAQGLLGLCCLIRSSDDLKCCTGWLTYHEYTHQDCICCVPKAPVCSIPKWGLISWITSPPAALSSPEMPLKSLLLFSLISVLMFQTANAQLNPSTQLGHVSVQGWWRTQTFHWTGRRGHGWGADCRKNTSRLH